MKNDEKHKKDQSDFELWTHELCFSTNLFVVVTQQSLKADSLEQKAS